MIAFPESEIANPPHLDADGIAHDLGPNGPIAAAMGGYEDRPGQRDMAEAVTAAFNDGGTALLEAGTGVGKSLAYLVPALRWAALTGEKTLVSTNTINLQEQLVTRDLPFLANAFAGRQSVRFALMKGWRNYLCLLRMHQAELLGASLFDNSVAAEIAELHEWSNRTADGSLSDLPLPPSNEAWDEVAAEADLCIRTKCPHYQKCFVFVARRKAADAHVVVANHHLLMADVAVRRTQQNWDDAAVLPAYTRLVIDEGHHLEEAASAHLGATASRRSLTRLFSRLENRGRGLIPTLTARLNADRDAFALANLDLVRQRISPALAGAREKSSVAFDLIEAALRDSGQKTFRLTSEFAFHPVWKRGLDAALTDLLASLKLMDDTLKIVRERLSTKSGDAALYSLVAELQGVSRRMESIGSALEGALRPSPSDILAVRWIESRGRESNVAVSWVPLNLAPILRDDLFERVETAVITSATLAADGSFNFIRTRLGLDSYDSPPEEAVYPSPFDYAKQALFVVPTDFPAPGGNDAAHFQAVIEAATDLCEASDGGVFLLFTSHRDVRLAASELRARGMEQTRPILVHGEIGRDRLLTMFRDSGRALLIGTSSYWEGVDVAGSALRGLLIARLPFKVPSNPMTAAHCEAIQAEGGDAFAEYMVPHAALRLKQGFGRLIRSSRDRGVVILADPRVISRGYGDDLLKGLPPARRLFAPWSEVRQQLKHFYHVSNEDGI